jgi:hypothetical protein
MGSEMRKSPMVMELEVTSRWSLLPGLEKELATVAALESVAVERCFPNDAAARSRRRFLSRKFHNVSAAFPNPGVPTRNRPFR